MVNLEVAASWSGGKDSCLACYKAMERGYQIRYLLNFISEKYKRCCFHGIQRELINLQADLIGISLFQKKVSPDMKLYEKEFKEAVNHLKTKKVKGMVFGDIYLTEHKNWVQRVCKDLKIKVIEPLWQISPEEIIEEFIHLGFKAVVVSAKAELFEKDIIGREINHQFLQELKERKICPCGENGEFHTFVIDGPLFKGGGIEITKSRTVQRRGFWPHWFLDIQKWQVRNKQKLHKVKIISKA
ncbi:MAG: diphthine--ammonia ligase [Candidatus Doudnabacteria bacterium]